MKRKHRVVVEITTNKPITARAARIAVDLLLERVDTQVAPIWANGSNIYADKLTCKEFDRVMRKLSPQQGEKQ
jgi:hypothetical protein